MTPLARELAERIALEGPMGIDAYMALCLGHPQHGYYMRRDPFGRGGDFTTAPEISQMFGELLGLWVVSLWDQMGRPDPVQLVELGPGRGTLMADMLRAARALPPFLKAVRVTLVEMSPALMRLQQQALAPSGVPVTWCGHVASLEPGRAIVIANEFFDALPIRQFVRAPGGWCERQVGQGENGLAFGLSGPVGDAVAGLDIAGLPPRAGDVREICAAGLAVMQMLAQRFKAQGGALLAIDYGYARPAYGDSLQAMQAHAFVDPLAEPGAADLTAHVDFTALGAAARAAGADVHPLLTQGEMLNRLGIGMRAEVLARANPAAADDLAAALLRLAGNAEGQMGTLFKALCVSSGLRVPPPVFDMPDPLIDKRGP